MKRPVCFLVLLLAMDCCTFDGVRAGSVSVGAPPTASVLTSHWDNNRDNWNQQETILTPANVSGGHFGKLGSLAISGPMLNQPVYVPAVVTSSGQKDLVIAATLGNIVSAFDANNLGAAVWSVSFGGLRSSYPSGNNLYGSSVGCVSSPAVDPVAGLVYVLCADSAAPSWIIHILNVATGSQVHSITVTGTVVGTGDPNGGDSTSGANLLFYPYYSLSRCSLTLANGNVYVSFGSFFDNHPYHGWIMGYSTSSLSQIGVWCATPNNYGGALWFSGAGPAVDSSGNLYVTTGNGLYDGSTNFADSVVKLSPTLAVLDWFTPSNYATLESADGDVSAGRVMLLTNGKMIVAFKDFTVYVIDSACMGHLQGSSVCDLQTLTTASGSVGANTGTYGGAFGVGAAFLPIVAGPIYKFSYASGSFNSTPLVGSTSYAFPGAAQMALSSNGQLTPVLWISTSASSSSQSVQPGTLRAINPGTLAEYWNSDTVSGDGLGNLAKFGSPMIANGRVYVCTNSGTIVVYGMGAH